MKPAFRIIILICLCLTVTGHSFERLYVDDPQNPWRSGTGTIEEVVLSVRPLGVYMEVGLYLTFSADGLSFPANTQLETELLFDLPEQAIVRDLWLWVGQDIMRADILDMWTASGIYNGIVNRRRDPAILFKRSAIDYELRVYPMLPNETRKVKLTYLIPTEWTSSTVSIPLPASLINTSRTSPETIYVLFWDDDEWINPRIKEHPGSEFIPNFDPLFGNFQRAELPFGAENGELTLEVDAPLQNGIYVNRLDEDGSGFYQLVVLPSSALDLGEDQKVVCLFDYDIAKSNVGITGVLNAARTMLENELADADSFNLIFTGLSGTVRAADNWFPATAAGVEAAFSAAGPSPLLNFSDLPTLLADGIDFIQTNGNDGSILLISNTDQMRNQATADATVNLLITSMDPNIPISIADYNNLNLLTNSIGGKIYVGNQYFYEQLSEQTGGVFENIANHGSLLSTLAAVSSLAENTIEAFDLHAQVNNGFTFARYTLSETDGALDAKNGILQIGKYFGDFPLTVQVSGLYQGQPHTRTTTIDDSSTSEQDSLHNEMWTGQRIHDMESEFQSDNIIESILDLSIEERILSLYTAFLALEPSDTVFACVDCQDESGLAVGIEDIEQQSDDSLFVAFPNPFNNRTTIKVKLTSNFATSDSELSFKIYNTLGQLVKTFPAEADSGNREYQFIWDGVNEHGLEVGSGTYFFVVSSATRRQVLRLLLVK